MQGNCAGQAEKLGYIPHSADVPLSVPHDWNQLYSNWRRGIPLYWRLSSHMIGLQFMRKYLRDLTLVVGKLGEKRRRVCKDPRRSSPVGRCVCVKKRKTWEFTLSISNRMGCSGIAAVAMRGAVLRKKLTQEAGLGQDSHRLHIVSWWALQLS